MCLWAVRSVHSTRYDSHGKGRIGYLSCVPGVSQKYMANDICTK